MGTDPQLNGLTRWRQRKQEEKEARLAQLAELRKTATEVVRDGRVYLVVHVPDQYDFKKGGRDGDQG